MTSSRKKRYSPPKLRKLNREHATLILLGQAWDGDEKAQELLECAADVLFPTSGQQRPPSRSDFVTASRESKRRPQETAHEIVN